MRAELELGVGEIAGPALLLLDHSASPADCHCFIYDAKMSFLE